MNEMVVALEDLSLDLMAESSKLALAHGKMCAIVEVGTECSGGAEEEYPNSLRGEGTLGRLKESFLEGVSQELIREKLEGTSHWAMWKRAF